MENDFLGGGRILRWNWSFVIFYCEGTTKRRLYLLNERLITGSERVSPLDFTSIILCDFTSELYSMELGGSIFQVLDQLYNRVI